VQFVGIVLPATATRLSTCRVLGSICTTPLVVTANTFCFPATRKPLAGAVPSLTMMGFSFSSVMMSPASFVR
jgi:hypothetical protein